MKNKTYDFFWNKGKLLKREFQMMTSGRRLPLVRKEIAVGITYKCNENCNYCYTGNIAESTNFDMDIEKFKKVVEWIKPQDLRILFIGGEPTEHPKISEMVDICREKGVNFILVTNNLFDSSLLIKMKGLKYTAENVISYKIATQYSEKKSKIYDRNLKLMKELKIPFYLYFNVQKTDKLEQYDQLIDYAKEFGVKIGLCVTIPHGLDLKDEAEKIIHIVNRSEKQGVKCEFTRPLPKCMFTKEEWNKLKPVIGKYHKYSVCDYGPLIINPDLSIFPCISLNTEEMKGPSIFTYKNLNEAFNNYMDMINKIARTPVDEKCVDCIEHIEHKCIAGCLVNKKSVF